MRFVPIANFSELPEGRARGYAIEGLAIALVRVGESVFAMDSRCPHAGGRLDRSTAVAFAITCPMHGARFDIRTGQCMNAPYDNIRTFQTRISDGIVEIGFPE